MKGEWKHYIRAAVTVFALYLCIHHWPDLISGTGLLFKALEPVVIGFVLAYILNILLNFYEKHLFRIKLKKETRLSRFFHNRRKGVCIFLSAFTLVFLITVILLLVIPQLIACVELLIEKLPPAADSLIQSLLSNEWLKEKGWLDEIELFIQEFDWRARLKQFSAVITGGLGDAVSFLTTTITTTVSGVVTAFLSLIFAFYMLGSKDRLHDQTNAVLDRFVPAKWAFKIRYVCKVLNDCFHRYIVGQCTEAVILGALCTVGMMILGIPYATMIGALIAFTALIPIAGAYIGAGVGAFMILTVNPVQALIFLIFLVILQQLEGNLIYPRVVGSSIGLPGMWVLLAVTLGGSLMGILGMLLFVPLTAAVYRLLREMVQNGRGVGIGETK